MNKIIMLAPALLLGATVARAQPARNPAKANAVAPKVTDQDEELYSEIDELSASDDPLNADWSRVEELLNAGANGYATFQGATALMLMAFVGEETPLKDSRIQLLIARSDINAQNKHGRTALHQAAFYGGLKLMKMLIAAGADLNLRDEDGKTARDLASKYKITLEQFDKAVANRPTTAPATPPATDRPTRPVRPPRVADGVAASPARPRPPRRGDRIAAAGDVLASPPFFTRNRAIVSGMNDPSSMKANYLPLFTTQVQMQLGVEPFPPKEGEQRSLYSTLLPSYHSFALAAASRQFKDEPENKVALAQRAAQWPHTFRMALNSDSLGKLVELGAINRQYTELDMRGVMAGPLTPEMFGPVLRALQVEDYAPHPAQIRSGRAAEVNERIKALKAALVAFTPIVPSAQETVMVLDAKAAISRLSDAPDDADNRANAEAFLVRAREFSAANSNSPTVGLMALAVEAALGKIQLTELSARATTFNSPGFAENCAGISLFLNDLNQNEKAKIWCRAWNAVAAASADAANSPHLMLAQAQMLAPSRERFELLKKCAIPFSFDDRYKNLAVSQLVSDARQFGDRAWQRRALEEAVMSIAMPYTWQDYAQFALEDGQWGNAFNANRIIVGWQERTPDSPISDEQRAAVSPLDPLPASAIRPVISRRMDARLKGAFLMLKLGYFEASRAEYAGAIGESLPEDAAQEKKDKADTIGADFETTFLLHRRFLRAELAKTPDDADLKAALDRLVALKVDAAQHEKWVMPIL